MKYVVLSFDDARKDFYINALPILKKYRLKATLNVITEYVGKNDLTVFASGNHVCMSYDEIIEANNYGIEIASHSADHTNNIEKVRESLNWLKENIKEGEYGFASPGSVIYSGNYSTYRNLLTEHDCAYIRSGTVLRREGFIQILLYVLSKYSRLPFFYKLLNKRNILSTEKKYDYYPSITCNADTSAKQIISVIKSLKENQACILMFHSILYNNDPGYGKDKWYNTIEDFENICRVVMEEPDLSVVTNMELFRLMQ